MRAVRISPALLFACLALAPAPTFAADKVDLLLVLAADVSRSIDAEKFQLQRNGYVAALANPRVLDAIATGRYGRIGLTFVEWSGVGNQKVVIEWTLIDGTAAAKSFGDRLLEAPRSFWDRTSISGGIEFATAQLAAAPYDSARRTIDVSGDGTNNAGPDVATLRDRAVAKGITINGLPILSANPMSWNPDHTNPPGGLANYYRDNVIGGPMAFVRVAKDFNAFGDAIIEKMIAEVSQAHEPQRRAARRAAALDAPRALP